MCVHHIVDACVGTSWTPTGGVFTVDLARYVVEAVLVEGHSYREVARARAPPEVKEAIVRLRCELTLLRCPRSAVC